MTDDDGLITSLLHFIAVISFVLSLFSLLIRSQDRRINDFDNNVAPNLRRSLKMLNTMKFNIKALTVSPAAQIKNKTETVGNDISGYMSEFDSLVDDCRVDLELWQSKFGLPETWCEFDTWTKNKEVVLSTGDELLNLANRYPTLKDGQFSESCAGLIEIIEQSIAYFNGVLAEAESMGAIKYHPKMIWIRNKLNRNSSSSGSYTSVT